MKRYLSIALITAGLGLQHFAFAESSLVVSNNLSDIDVNITTDLSCKVVHKIFQIRYTSPLDENPIHPNQGEVKATWQNCSILSAKYFADAKQTDHSKIYITLVDTKTGDQFIATLQAQAGETRRDINFADHAVRVTMNYKLKSDLTSETRLSIDPARK